MSESDPIDDADETASMADHLKAHVTAVGPQYLVSGRYRIKSKIGDGGMGAVWLATDQQLGRDVAAKQVIIPPGASAQQTEEMRLRAHREGRAAARLSHRNAIALHDVVTDQGEPWLIMEYLPSRSLAQVLSMAGTLPPLQAAQLAAQIADALVEAHSRGIIHRDIKPGNILIANEGNAIGTVKLTDFGISRIEDDVQLTQTGLVSGTVAYFAPEVALGGTAGEKSDVYALGATLYTAVEGVPPFGTSTSSLSLLHKVASGRINPPRNAGPITTVLLEMLNPDPNARLGMAAARDGLLSSIAHAGVAPHTALAQPLSAPAGTTPVWVRKQTASGNGAGPNASGSGRGVAPVRPNATAALANRPSGPIPNPIPQQQPAHLSAPPQFPSSTPLFQQLPDDNKMPNGVLATLILLGFVAIAAIGVLLVVSLSG